MIQIVLRQSGSSYITSSSSKNNVTWVRILSQLLFYYPFFLGYHFTIPRTPLHYLFWSQSECTSPFGLHVRLTASVLRPFATALFSEGNARMFYWLCHREPNTITTIHLSLQCVCYLNATANSWLECIFDFTGKKTNNVIIKSTAHLAMALIIFPVDCDSHVWQCSFKKSEFNCEQAQWRTISLPGKIPAWWKH